MGYRDVSTACNSKQLSIVENPSVRKDEGNSLAFLSVPFRFVTTSIFPISRMLSAEECTNRYKIAVRICIENP